MDKQKKLLFLIIIIFIIIIAITITISIIKSSEEKNVSDELNTQYDGYLNEIENPASLVNGKKPELVKFENIYFNAKNCVNKFLSYINDKNEDAIISVLDEEYISTNNINKNNILNSDFLPKSIDNYIIEDMYSITGMQYTSFYIKGKAKDNKNIYLIVNIDYEKKTFSIKPIQENEFNKEINNEIEGRTGKEKSIEENEYNILEVSKLQEEDIVISYFNDFKDKLIDYPDLAYEIIDKEYREKRFPSYEDFKVYIEENIENIKNTIITKYSLENKNGNKVFICIDDKNNYYTFNVTSAMKYTVLLDNYTLETEEYKTEYKKLNEKEKVSTNIDKFIKCINNKDYKQAYSYLDEKFKNNYFKTIDSFKEYVDKNFYNNNIVKDIEIKNEGNIFICTITIKSGIGAGASVSKKTFNLLLKEDTDFVMSFNIQ